MAATITCSHDSGSATGNRPLCTSRATAAVTYGHGAYRVTIALCEAHVEPTVNRVWPDTATITR
jgi:hypothetical protein